MTSPQGLVGYEGAGMKAAAIQMQSGRDPALNLQQLEQEIASLKQQGAELVVTPENTLIFGSTEDYHQHAERLDEGPLQQALAGLAAKYQLWLIIGSFPTKAGNGKLHTTCLVFSPQGGLVSHYHKIHLFDVDVADSHQRYRESDTFERGDKAVIATTPFANIGLSICYDVRFPLLYTDLREQGADILVVPAAFTFTTGRAHWETLLRARAIETQCWVIAAAQWGEHSQGRHTWGHSMIIDPWGKIQACQPQGIGSVIAELDLVQSQTIRTNMPLMDHTQFEVHPRDKIKSD